MDDDKKICCVSLVIWGMLVKKGDYGIVAKDKLWYMSWLCWVNMAEEVMGFGREGEGGW